MIIKVCGLREADNIRAVDALGVDWMGFIFYPRSPRYVANVPAYLPEKAGRIGVFVDTSMEEILQRVQDFRLDGIQLHGRESPAFCRKLRERLDDVPATYRRQLIKALSIRCVAETTVTDGYQPMCDYLLFDTPTCRHGGSGESFDWSLLQHYRGKLPFLLSGGISPDSLPVLMAFRHPRWAGIDLNSRFEERPGYKNISSLHTFIHSFKHLNV